MLCSEAICIAACCSTSVCIVPPLCSGAARQPSPSPCWGAPDKGRAAAGDGALGLPAVTPAAHAGMGFATLEDGGEHQDIWISPRAAQRVCPPYGASSRPTHGVTSPSLSLLKPCGCPASDSRVYFQGEEGEEEEEREGERKQLFHTNLPGMPVSENLSIANCNLLVCPPQVSHY